MIFRGLSWLFCVFYAIEMCYCREENAEEASQWEPPRAAAASRPVHHRLCTCHKYNCSCCINFSFIHRWKALGCFNIQSLPGNLNIVLSFSFNNRHLAVFPIAGSRPMPFCKQLHSGSVAACLVIYNVRTNTPHDIMVCLYMELRVGDQSVATIHLDCVRKLHRHLQFIPITSHHRKGTVLDVHVLPNDTALTILKQEFHWTREADSDSDSLHSEDESSESDEDSEEGEEEEIKIVRKHRLLHWLKRLLWWTYD